MTDRQTQMKGDVHNIPITFYPPTERFGGYSDGPQVAVCPSVCPSVYRRNLGRPITPIPFELFS